MRKFLKSILFSTSLLVISCTPKMFRKLPLAGGDYKSQQVQLFHPGITESLVYKTVMTYKDKEFSSLTYFNQLGDSAYKIVLLTTFGNTLLEAEISKDNFKVNNV